MDTTILRVGGSLLILIGINILLGSMSSLLEKRFKRRKFFQGLLKGVVVAFCFAGCYGVGYFNPDIIVINANGQDFNLLNGVNLLLLSGYLFYAKEVLLKLSAFVGKKLEIKE